MAENVTGNKVTHQETWLWRDIWALPSLSCTSMVHWEAKCAAVKPRPCKHTYMHTHLTPAQRGGLSDEGGQRPGRLLHGTLDMIRGHSLKYHCHFDDTALWTSHRRALQQGVARHDLKIFGDTWWAQVKLGNLYPDCPRFVMQWWSNVCNLLRKSRKSTLKNS